ncbi:MAG: cytochrome c [Alphaproteobacteria bacterium]
MTSRARLCALGAALSLFVVGAGAGWAQQPPPVVKQRQDVMKEQGRALAAIKAFLDGKGDQAAAQAGADDLLKTLPQIPDVFPQKTSSAEYPGQTRAKPDIWAEWDKFLAAQQNALSKARALDAAVKTGDKPQIQTAFADMGQNGCNGCHTPFREPQRQ